LTDGREGARDGGTETGAEKQRSETGTERQRRERERGDGDEETEERERHKTQRRRAERQRQRGGRKKEGFEWILGAMPCLFVSIFGGVFMF